MDVASGIYSRPGIRAASTYLLRTGMRVGTSLYHTSPKAQYVVEKGSEDVSVIHNFLSVSVEQSQRVSLPVVSASEFTHLMPL